MTAQEYMNAQDAITAEALTHALTARLADTSADRMRHHRAFQAKLRQARHLAQEWAISLMRGARGPLGAQNNHIEFLSPRPDNGEG